MLTTTLHKTLTKNNENELCSQIYTLNNRSINNRDLIVYKQDSMVFIREKCFQNS